MTRETKKHSAETKKQERKRDLLHVDKLLLIREVYYYVKR